MDQIYEEIISEMNEEELLQEYSDLKQFRKVESERGQVSPSIIKRIQLVVIEFESWQN